MTPEEWAELERITSPAQRRFASHARTIALLELTGKEDEHPEGYGGPCRCRTCRSQHAEP
jgi:hypothetical protein